MLGDQNRHPVLFVQTPQKRQKFLHALRIHLRDRLIQNEKPRMRDEDGRQSESLPLPAGKRVNASFLKAGQSRLFQSQRDFPRDFLRRFAAIFQRKSHFVFDRHREKLIVRRLVHRADQEPDILRRHRKRVAPVQQDFTFCFRAVAQKTRDRLDERRFPAAALPRQEHHIPFRQRQRQRSERFLLPRPIAAGKIFDFQHHWLITPDNFFPSFIPSHAPMLLYTSPFTMTKRPINQSA